MRIKEQLVGMAALAMASLAAPMSAGAAVITFDSRDRGEIITNQYVVSDGVLIRANNADPSGPDAAIIFVTYPQFNEPDPDLRPPYDRGNLSGGDHYPDRVLIIPENINDQGGGPNGGPNGLVDFPNDEAEGGWIEFTFAEQQTSLGFDVIDAEGITRDFANGYGVRFYQGEVLVGQVTFRRFLNNNSKYYDPSVEFGNNSINRIRPIEATSLEQAGFPLVTSFNRVVFDIGESGALDNIVFTPVPEPGTAALAMLGLGGLLATRRTRRRRL